MNAPKYLVRISSISNLSRGTLIRRIGNGKDQQGIFDGFTDDRGLIIKNAIDLSNGTFAAESGVIFPMKGDTIYRYSCAFTDSPLQSRALQVVREWSLFKKHPDLRDAILEFVRTSFAAEHVLQLQEQENLRLLFVPLQQRFKIGKYVEEIDWSIMRNSMFLRKLESLDKGDHITYIAFIPDTKSYPALFYSIGTKPHQETHVELQRESFSFKPSHGGHIKKASSAGDPEVYIVDAGSNYLGRGIKTSITSAEQVVSGLYSIFNGFTFIPVEGRGAFGTQQSY